MSLKQHIGIHVSAQEIFAAYEDIASWVKWDQTLEEVVLPQGLLLGSRGWLKPKQGPKTKITISALTPQKSFVVTSHLPFARMDFSHELRRLGDKTLVVHRITFAGPLGAIFQRLIGGTISQSLYPALEALKEYCETNR